MIIIYDTRPNNSLNAVTLMNDIYKIWEDNIDSLGDHIPSINYKGRIPSPEVLSITSDYSRSMMDKIVELHLGELNNNESYCQCKFLENEIVSLASYDDYLYLTAVYDDYNNSELDIKVFYQRLTDVRVEDDPLFENMLYECRSIYALANFLVEITKKRIVDAAFCSTHPNHAKSVLQCIKASDDDKKWLNIAIEVTNDFFAMRRYND